MLNASSNESVAHKGPKPLPKVRWNSFGGVAYLLFIFFAAQLLAGSIVASVAAITDVSLETSVGIQFSFILLTEIFSIGAVYWFLTYYKHTFADIGLRKPVLSDLLYGISAVPVYFILYIITVAIAQQIFPSLDVGQEQQLGFNNVVGALPLILTFVSLVILPPIAEEIMVRGFLYSSLKKAMKIIPAAIVTSLLFAAAHLSAGGAAGPLYIAAVDTFVLSLVLIWLRERTQGLWAPIILHAIKNGIAFLLLFIFKVA